MVATNFPQGRQGVLEGGREGEVRVTPQKKISQKNGFSPKTIPKGPLWPHAARGCWRGRGRGGHPPPQFFFSFNFFFGQKIRRRGHCDFSPKLQGGAVGGGGGRGRKGGSTPPPIFPPNFSSLKISPKLPGGAGRGEEGWWVPPPQKMCSPQFYTVCIKVTNALISACSSVCVGMCVCVCIYHEMLASIITTVKN